MPTLRGDGTGLIGAGASIACILGGGGRGGGVFSFFCCNTILFIIENVYNKCRCHNRKFDDLDLDWERPFYFHFIQCLMIPILQCDFISNKYRVILSNTSYVLLKS